MVTWAMDLHGSNVLHQLRPDGAAYCGRLPRGHKRAPGQWTVIELPRAGQQRAGPGCAC